MYISAYILALFCTAQPPDDYTLPPLDDLRRLPCAAVAAEQHRLWSDYRRWLVRAQPVWTERLREIDVWMVQADEAARVWDALAEAHGPYASGWYRRGKLAELRDRLKPWNYDAGRMPPLLHAPPARTPGASD